jgi:hypothetical protein
MSLRTDFPIADLFLRMRANDEKPSVIFQILSRHLIRKHLPSQYHGKNEYEFEVGPTHIILQAWKTKSRKDTPAQHTLDDDERNVMMECFKLLSA